MLVKQLYRDYLTGCFSYNFSLNIFKIVRLHLLFMTVLGIWIKKDTKTLNEENSWDLPAYESGFDRVFFICFTYKSLKQLSRDVTGLCSRILSIAINIHQTLRTANCHTNDGTIDNVDGSHLIAKGEKISFFSSHLSIWPLAKALFCNQSYWFSCICWHYHFLFGRSLNSPKWYFFFYITTTNRFSLFWCVKTKMCVSVKLREIHIHA